MVKLVEIPIFFDPPEHEELIFTFLNLLSSRKVFLKKCTIWNDFALGTCP